MQDNQDDAYREGYEDGACFLLSCSAGLLMYWSGAGGGGGDNGGDDGGDDGGE